LGLLLEDLVERFNASVGTCCTFLRWINYIDLHISFLLDVNRHFAQEISTKVFKMKSHYRFAQKLNAHYNLTTPRGAALLDEEKAGFANEVEATQNIANFIDLMLRDKWNASKISYCSRHYADNKERRCVSLTNLRTPFVLTK
ncbi:hypothetical protein MAR_017377, partial [Mya arenaria]